MKFRNFLVVLFVVALTFSIFCGCGKTETMSTDENVSEVKKEEDTVVEDELVLSVGKVDICQFDPKKGWGKHRENILTHSSLLTIDENLNFVGDLAKSYEVSMDGLEWTFVIRDDVKFSNGEYLTPEDVKFTYNELKNDGMTFNLSFLNNIEVINESTLKMTLDKPQSTFIAQLTEIGILPEKYYDENYTSNPIGSGPYKIVQYDVGQQVIMEYNPHWYGKEPYFKKFTFLLYDTNTALAAAKAGTVDVVYIPSSLSDQKVDGMTLHALESVDSKGITLSVIPSGEKEVINDIEILRGNDVTSDIAIRKALNIGVNRQKLVDSVLNGYGKPAYSVCDTMPWFNKETIVEDGNIDKAKQILKDAGWIDNNKDGILEKNDKDAEFDLYFSSADQLRSDLALVFSDQALDLGIKINLIGTTWDVIKEKGRTAGVVWSSGKYHPHQLYTMHSSKTMNVGYNNMSSYVNPVTDEYLEKAIKSTTQEEANKYWKLAQWDGNTGFSSLGEIPIIWLFSVDNLFLVNDNIDITDEPIRSYSHEWSFFSTLHKWKPIN